MVSDSAAMTSPDSTADVAYIDVALPLPIPQTFTYRISEAVTGKVTVGARLIVPFGRRRLTGYCVALHSELDEEIDLDEKKIREVMEVVDEEPLLTSEILELTQWAAGYYASSWGEMLKASLPAGINSLIETVLTTTAGSTPFPDELTETELSVFGAVRESNILSFKQLFLRFGENEARNAVRGLIAKGFLERSHRITSGPAGVLTRKAAVLLDADHEAGNEKQRRVIECLREAPEGLTLSELQRKARVGASPVKTLEKRGVIRVFPKEIHRDPLAGSSLPEASDHSITADQKAALKLITAALDAGVYKTFLLHGITGSGKTEVYIRAMQSALESGRTALMMVPEIALTPVFSKQLRSIFGRTVAILHSSLSGGERYDEWRRIRRGEAKVVIGTRSAVFAPLEDLGIIVVDEEHDSSYRQHEMPFYHGRDTAIVRAQKTGAVVILGSATPALESFHNAIRGKYERLVLPERISGRPLARAELIDMREMFREGGGDNVLSEPLVNAIEETHSNSEQSIILLNRRGFSQFVLCRSCGKTIKCRNCEITLTFHRGDQKLTCHYCGFAVRTPDACPECDSRFLYFLGEGTEQIEEILAKRFPGVRIARVDRDTTRRKKQLERTLEKFGRHEIDMLVGTQMIAKGHDFPNVTLVGVISVDAGLAMPEFRSAERTFQLLTQSAGRAGRGEKPGRVLIQTYYPEHYALKHARTQDYEAFYEQEIEFRKRLNYPPFVALGLVMFRHKNYRRCLENAVIMRDALQTCAPEGKCIVLGPAPAPLSKLKGEYRVQILVKSRDRRVLRETIDIAAANAESASCDLKMASIEIDPINLL